MPKTHEPRHLDVLDAPARQVRINLDEGDLMNLRRGGNIVVQSAPDHDVPVEVYLTFVPHPEVK